MTENIDRRTKERRREADRRQHERRRDLVGMHRTEEADLRDRMQRATDAISRLEAEQQALVLRIGELQAELDALKGAGRHVV